MKLATVAVLASSLALASADVYLHLPRGANDRCDEKSNDRNNDRRLYDTENNAAGGYAIGENDMVYYEGTTMRIEFYSQHSCGNGASNKDDVANPESTICQHIIQLGCENTFSLFAGAEADTYQLTDGMSVGRPCLDGEQATTCTSPQTDVYETFGNTCTQRRPLRSECTRAAIDAANAQCAGLDLAGGNTGTFNSDTCKCSDRKWKTYGLHEPEAWWQMCRWRQRNGGLFTADQNVNSNQGATATRQEPNSDRYGFECPEERDYWPYWHPSPWMDLAVLASNTSVCTSAYLAQSQNTVDKCLCVPPAGTSDADAKEMYAANQELSCAAASGEWKCFGKWNWPAPECLQAPHQTDNRLGNVNTKGDTDGAENNDAFAHYAWNIPYGLIPENQNDLKCVIRLRYNISTWETDMDFDRLQNKAITNNPVHSYGAALDTTTTQSPVDVMPVRMAINTAQFGRTFQDRTHVFRLSRRPAELEGRTIHNLNIRGKRGNIAQVRNCVEYDFVPGTLNVKVGDYVHFQFDGSDYNPNGNAGEGRAGTDRSNVIVISDYERNLPQSLNRTATVFSTDTLATLAWINQKPENCYTNDEMLDKRKKGNQGNDPKSCHFLNGARQVADTTGRRAVNQRVALPTPYFSHVAEVTAEGSMYYMSSRNNNFSNRSQKAAIIAEPSISGGAIAGIVIGTVVGAALVGVAGFAVYSYATKGSVFGKFSSRV